MTDSKLESALNQFAGVLAQQMGLYFPENRLSDLRRGLASASKEFGCQDVESCIEWLMSSPLNKKQIETLASHLTIGETYFFREKKCLEAFTGNILKEALVRHRSDHNLRIWSAGCASGEEPYSVAISLVTSIPEPEEWNVKILATDINPQSLQKALKGVYNSWSFRDCPAGIQERFFEKRGEGKFEINSEIKKMVTFSYHNLAQDVFPSLISQTNALDIIFCRNVLMYFAPEMAQKVINRFYQSLVVEGCLVVSPTETSQAFRIQFTAANYGQCTVYKKSQECQVETGEQGPGSRQRPAIPWPTAEPESIAGSGKPLLARVVEQSPLGNQKATPTASPGFYDKAVTLYSQGCYSEAGENALSILKERPEDSRAAALLARVQANLGQLAEAEKWCQKAISSDKLNPNLHYLLGTILHEQGQVNAAVRAFNQTLYLKPDFVLAHFTLGNLNLQSGKFQEAARHFKNALAALKKYSTAELVPESDGFTAGRLGEVVSAYLEELL